MAFSSWRTWSTSEVVTAAHMNQEIRDNGLALFPDGDTVDSWTIQLEATTSNPSGSWTGFQYQIGALMTVWARFVLSANGNGVFFVTLPAAAVSITGTTVPGSGQVVGSWHGRDDTGTITSGGSVLLASSTTVRFGLEDFATGQRTVDDDSPWVWAADDVLTMHAVYPVA